MADSPQKLDATAEGCALPDSQSAATWIDAVLLVSIFVVMCLGLGRYGFYEPHEGHFSGVGREMLASGDWITPHLNGAPYLNKPPLLYWMVATSYALFGVTEWAARFPLALIGWIGVFLSWNWARRLWGIKAGRIAAVILSVSAGWYLFSHQLMIDLLLSVLHLAMVYAFWLAVMERESLRRWNTFYVVVALSVLAKGPIGIVFALALVVLYAIVRRDWKILNDCRPFIGALIVSAIVAPWLIQIEMRNPGYLKYAIWNENVKRAMDQRWPPDYSVVKVSPIIYVLITLTWMAPWSLLVPQVSSFVVKKSRLGAQQESPQGIADGILILSLAALIPVLIFLPIPARLIYYSLPTVPAYAVLAAGWWSLAGGDCYSKGRKAAVAALSILGVAVFSAGFWVPAQLQQVPDLAAAPDTIRYVDKIAFIIGVALVVGAVLMALKRTGWSMAAMAVLLALACGYNIEGFREFDAVRSSRRTVTALREKTGEKAKDWVWISEGSKEIGASAGIAWYLGFDGAGKPQSVYIMEDDPHRLPPSFPGAKPKYLIDQTKLNEIWQSDQPAVFVTDFARKDWFNDAPRLPGGERHHVEVAGSGQRRIYANKAAWAQLNPNAP